jgi:hypothetical protein
MPSIKEYNGLNAEEVSNGTISILFNYITSLQTASKTASETVFDIRLEIISDLLSRVALIALSLKHRNPTRMLHDVALLDEYISMFAAKYDLPIENVFWAGFVSGGIGKMDFQEVQNVLIDYKITKQGAS